MSEPTTTRISPTAKKLADRYGISPETMEEIISDTRGQTRVRETPYVAPPVTPSATPIAPPPVVVTNVASAPATGTRTTSTAADTPHQTPVTRIFNPVVPVNLDAENRDRGLSAGAVILGILFILALVLFFYFRPWSETTSVVENGRDTTRPAKDSAIAEVLPSADTVDHSKDFVPPPKPHHKAVHHVRHHARTHYYTTSSNLQAQEHLADLRARGNRSAHLETIQRGDNTYYRLHQNAK